MNKTNVVCIRFTPDEMKDLRALAADRSQTVSEFIRRQLNDQLHPTHVTWHHPETATTSSALSPRAATTEVGARRG